MNSVCKWSAPAVVIHPARVFSLRQCLLFVLLFLWICSFGISYFMNTKYTASARNNTATR